MRDGPAQSDADYLPQSVPSKHSLKKKKKICRKARQQLHCRGDGALARPPASGDVRKLREQGQSMSTPTWQNCDRVCPPLLCAVSTGSAPSPSPETTLSAKIPRDNQLIATSGRPPNQWTGCGFITYLRCLLLNAAALAYLCSRGGRFSTFPNHD